MNLKMILILFSFLFVSTLQRKLDWSSLKPMEMIRYPQNKSIIVNSPYSNWKSLSRIVGGIKADPKMFPYQAALLILNEDGKYFCGSTLISKRCLLTAAHCADGAKEFSILLGTNSLQDETPGELMLQTKSSVIHPNWNESTIENDIALVLLNEDIPFSDQISPVTLATRNDSLENKEAVTVGWGKRSDFSIGVTPNLRFTHETILSNSVCETFFGSFPKNDICLSGSSLRGPCSGDSGGPLIVDNEQVGIVSFGGILCQIGWPSGYTRVSAYIDFISDHCEINTK